VEGREKFECGDFGWKHEIHLDAETWSEQKDAEVYEQDILKMAHFEARA
jgi:hypothetical protein